MKTNDEPANEVSVWIWVLCGVGLMVPAVVLVLILFDPRRHESQVGQGTSPNGVGVEPQGVESLLFGAWDTVDGEPRSIQFLHVNGAVLTTDGGVDLDLGDLDFAPDGGIIWSTAMGLKPGLFRFLQPDRTTIECTDYFGRKETFALKVSGEGLTMADESGRSVTLRRSVKQP